MHILFIVHQFRPEYATGTETVIFNIAKSCQRAGHRVKVLTCALTDISAWGAVEEDELFSTTVEGVPVYAIPISRISDYLALHQNENEEVRALVHRFLVKNNFDIAHIGHSLRMTAAIDEIRKINLPYVVTLTDFFPLCYRVNLMRTSGETCDGPHGGRACLTHCPVEGNLSGRFHYFHQFLAGARARIACSDFVRRQYVRAFPNLAFEVLPHGIDALRSCSIPPIPQEKERTGVVRFGFLGSLSKVKGVVMLLEAFAMADLPDALLEIVGPAYGDAETMHKIKLLAARSNVKIRGGVASDEVFGVLSRFDVLCLPSQVPETFSLVLHEGFACGIPALVSDLGAPAEIVRKHGCGWVISHTDVAGWAQAFRFIAHDPTILKQKKSRVPLPYRIEEEGFLYDHIYRRTGFLNHQNKSKKNEEQLKEPIRENINSKKLSWLSPIKLLRAWNRHRLFRRHLKG